MMPMRKQIQTLHVRSSGHNHKMDVFNPRQQKEKEVIVMGATGTGKSRLSIDLATYFPAEIINSDKTQVYQGLDIVTNKITKEEQRGVPHHLLGTLDPNKDFTARDFCDLASLAIESVLGRARLPIIVGGSNSYIEALVDDHDYKFHSKDECCFLWVDVSVPVLHSFVSGRVDHMVQNGMVDEARKFFDSNADYMKGIRRAIGVPEFDKYFRSDMISKGHQLLPPEIRHVVRSSEYEHLIAQESNSSQPGAKGFSCYEHGTINIAYRWGNFICVGVDSKLTDGWTGYVSDLKYNKFHQISRNISITMSGSKTAWEEMFRMIASVFSTIPEELHTVELAANLAYRFVSPSGMASSLVLGWDNTSPHPQMFRVISGASKTTGDSAMALGSGEQYINLRYLTDYYHGELAHAFQPTMLLLNQACLLDPFCGGVVRGLVLQRDHPPSCQYLNFFKQYDQPPSCQYLNFFN